MRTEIANASFRGRFVLAKRYIEEGEVVAFHTETVYGLGANAFSDEAVLKIFALKGRPADNPLIVHVHREYDISSLIDSEPPYAAALRSAYLPGPLTMVYPSTGKVSKYVSCGLNTLAIRVPSSPTAQAFLKEVDLPIAAPSANLSKHVSPVTARRAWRGFNGSIPLILDGGACSGGIESTVLDCTGDVPQILREGLVTREMISSVAGDCKVYRAQTGERPKSPGMAYKHYSPRCRTAYFTEVDGAKRAYLEEKEAGGSPCILCDSDAARELAGYDILELGATGTVMAQRLYALLRKGEGCATLLVGIEPRARDGCMAGVLNRMRRAFGAEHGMEES